MAKPINIFLSYVESDSNLVLQMLEHLVRLNDQYEPIVFCREGELLSSISPLTWERDNSSRLEHANIILLCLSEAYIEQNDLMVSKSYKLAKQKKVIVVPILLSECLFKDIITESVFPRYNGSRELEITSSEWRSHELAFESILQEVQKAVIKTEHYFNFTDYELNILNDQNNTDNRKTHLSSNTNTIASDKTEVGGDLTQISLVFEAGAQVTLGRGAFDIPSHQPIFSNELINLALWERIPFKEVIEPYAIIKLNREIEFNDKLCTDLLDNFGIESNLYYFICGCYTQRPDDLAKRIIHVFCDEGLIMDYAKTSNTNLIDNIATFDLKFGLTEKRSWSYFWQIIKKALPLDWRKMFAPEDNIPHSDDELQKQFDKFKETIIANITHKSRYPIILKIAKNIWSKSLESHIEYIIRKFSEIPGESQKFVLIFVFELSDLHNCWNTESHPILSYRNRVKALKKRIKELELCQHLFDVEIMDYLSEDDLFSWFKTLLKDDKKEISLRSAWNDFLTVLFKDMVEEEREAAKQKKYDMDRLISIQNKIYQRTKQM